MPIILIPPGPGRTSAMSACRRAKKWQAALAARASAMEDMVPWKNAWKMVDFMGFHHETYGNMMDFHGEMSDMSKNALEK